MCERERNVKTQNFFFFSHGVFVARCVCVCLKYMCVTTVGAEATGSDDSFALVLEWKEELEAVV